MAKALRFKVRWTLCDEVFLNDYAGKHTKSKHKDLRLVGRHRWISLLDKSDTSQSKMDAFFRSTPADNSNSSSAKKRKIASSVEITKLSELEEGNESATDQGESSAQKGKLLSVLWIPWIMPWIKMNEEMIY